ncbi:Signal recognition particle receptor subunit alpha [Thelohanellus kitauei]|uniref:Signal recognition particle receptor subunit alpha n=1 Tax=Thelohanellus kitauei TaxID=669202 RepID=A0A0C2MP07_THEKT|nr:Signal recognition particle receptor subunit alpha [Thelohanellus kitauei]
MSIRAKNVAADIADQICQSVSDQLLGKSLSSFQSVSSILRSCIEESLTKILTPKSKIQILDLISQNKTNRPFVIVFCGVNGVGKSTNLAKIAYYLLSNNQKVLIAACDTFRSGAVEQLRTHVARFNDMFPGDTPRCVLFDKGYGKDASGVAAEAIKTG